MSDLTAHKQRDDRGTDARVNLGTRRLSDAGRLDSALASDVTRPFVESEPDKRRVPEMADLRFILHLLMGCQPLGHDH